MEIRNPAYPIGSLDMRPITKITVLGVRLAIVLLAIYWLAIFLGTHLPATADFTPHVNDKAKHFWAFFLLGGLLCYVTNSPRLFTRFLTIGVVGTVYAALDEITQGLVPGRVPDVADFLTDALGLWTAIGLYVAAKLVHLRWMAEARLS